MKLYSLQEPPPAGRASPPEQAGGGNGWGCCEPRDPATGLYALCARVWLVQPAGCTPGVWRVAVYAVAAVQIEQEQRQRPALLQPGPAPDSLRAHIAVRRTQSAPYFGVNAKG